jgi:tight adherence protein B
MELSCPRAILIQHIHCEGLNVNALWGISILVFAAVAFAVEAAWLAFRARQANMPIKRRLELSKRFVDEPATAEVLRAEQGIFSRPAFRRVSDLLTQAGVRLDPKMLLIAVLAISSALFFALALLFGYRLTTLALALAFTFIGLSVFVAIRRKNRIARFAELLPDSIDIIVRAVRAGYPLQLALQLVAREIPHPLGTEFALTSEEISFGQDVRTAIDHLYRRVGQEDLLFLVVAINVQYQTGGNLAEILSRLSRLIRQRARLRLKIRALSAEGRVSALVLTLMPFILFGGISLISPGYFSEVRNHALFEPALIYGALSLVVGNVIMYRMVNFKF